MTESQLFTLVIATLNAGLAARSITSVTVQQGAQPRMQGAPEGMFLLLYKINWHPYGFPKRTDVWIPPVVSPPTPGFFQHIEEQIYEATIQCTGSIKQPALPAALLPLTGGDLIKIASRILQSDAGNAQLRAGGCGVERVGQIPQPYFKDDSDQFAQSPHFDFVLSFTDVDQSTTPNVVEEDFKIVRV